MSKYEEFSDVKGLLETCQEVERENRELVIEDHEFVTLPNGQWEDDRWEESDGKPRYTFDQTSPIVDQIAGDIEQSSFDIKLKPAGGDATKERAKLRDGLIRNIETMSNAQQIYSNAGRNVVTAGFDNWLVKADYFDDNSFNQDLMIVPIHNSENRVWYDVGSQKRDRSDSNYGFLLSSITRKDYEEEFPDGSGTSVSNQSLSDSNETLDKDEIIIGHFYFRKYKDRELVLTKLGREFVNDENFKKIEDELAESGETIVKRRTVKDSIFYMRKFDGEGWLGDEEETVFSSIPLVPVYANFKVIKNKCYYHGIVQKLKDSQRVLNYSLSREIEEGALAPRAKYWMSKAQAKGHKDELATMNTNSDPVQFFNPDPKLPGPPMQQGGAQINPGLRIISDGMQGMMNRASGIFAAGMGDNPNAQSGVAIEMLQGKSNNITVKFFKGVEIGVCRTGQLIDEALNRVYDVERQARIMNEDGTFDMVMVNEVVVDKESGERIVVNDLSAGRYDVTCTAGPSFDSRQTEANQAIIAVAAVDPTLADLGGDIILNNVNAPGMEKLAERKRMQLFNAGLIPEEQMTDEEKQKLADMNANKGADPMLVAAEAEMAKAQVGFQKNQLEMIKAENKISLEIEKLGLARQKLELDAQQKEIEFAEKLAKLNQDTQKQEFDQLITLRNQQRQLVNDTIQNLNTQADTFKKIREGMGSKLIIETPQGRLAHDNQAEEVLETQRQI